VHSTLTQLPSHLHYLKTTQHKPQRQHAHTHLLSCGHRQALQQYDMLYNTIASSLVGLCHALASQQLYLVCLNEHHH